MKIEGMSNEALVRSLMSFSWVAGSNDTEDKGNRYKPELLTRLDRGDKAVKAIEELSKLLAGCMGKEKIKALWQIIEHYRQEVGKQE